MFPCFSHLVELLREPLLNLPALLLDLVGEVGLAAVDLEDGRERLGTRQVEARVQEQPRNGRRGRRMAGGRLEMPVVVRRVLCARGLSG